MKTNLSRPRPTPASALLAAAVLALALPAAAFGHEGGHEHGDKAAHAEHAAPAAGGADAKAAFERVKKLAGEWQGTMMTPDGEPTVTRIEVTAGGHAVIEKMFAGSEHEMINVYHMDGGDLVVTHYCHAGNQPRMRYAPAKSGPDRLVFDFAGGSSLDPAKDGHIHEGSIALTGDDRMESAWGFYQGGKEAGVNKLYLSRRN